MALYGRRQRAAEPPLREQKRSYGPFTKRVRSAKPTMGGLLDGFSFT
jgi:hypothetical protein